MQHPLKIEALLTPGLDIGQLNALALKGLVQMFNRESRLFCHRLRQSPSGLVQEGLSHRYTVMALLGLHRCEKAGIEVSFEVRSLLENLLKDKAWISNIGDLGLLIWLCALALPEHVREVWSAADLRSAFEQSREVREGRTMELAWFLSGLAHAQLALGDEVQDFTELAQSTHGLLLQNQGAQGIFGHLARKGTPAGVLRGRIGSFADQVYPIYALSKFGQAYGAKAALDGARSCADAICRVQGSLGQWWWHYDAATGRVMEQYPVYSVHQEGMAPMALFALEDAARLDYSDSIYKGLQWIAGENEIACDLRDSSGLVWRSVRHRRKCSIFLERTQMILGFQPGTTPATELEILRECRPYELGWLLYALADRGSRI